MKIKKINKLIKLFHYTLKKLILNNKIFNHNIYYLIFFYLINTNKLTLFLN